MIAAFGTLAFLVTLWLLVVVAAATLEESGAKIAAALRGQSRDRSSPALTAIRVGARQRTIPVQTPMRAEPRLRVAA